MRKYYKNLIYFFCFVLAITLGLLFGKSAFFGNEGLTNMGLVNNVYDFGEIPQNKEVKVFFKYENIGSNALSIIQTDSRCGCTVANWNRDTLAENESDSLAVFYDAKALGYFSKEILIYYNTNKGPKQLFVTGTVLENK